LNLKNFQTFNFEFLKAVNVGFQFWKFSILKIPFSKICSFESFQHLEVSILEVLEWKVSVLKVSNLKNFKT